MSGEIEVGANEHGVVRLFSLSMPGAEADALRNAETLAAALGVSQADPQHSEVIAVNDIGGLGLAAYLTEGMGVRPDDVRAQRTRIDGLDGHVLLLRSAALDTTAQTLVPDPRLILIATLHEDRATPPPMTPLRSAGAAGTIAGAAPDAATPKRAGRGRLFAIVCVVAALLILILVLAGR